MRALLLCALAAPGLAGCFGECGEPERIPIADGTYALLRDYSRDAPEEWSHPGCGELEFTRSSGLVTVRYRDEAGREVVETWRVKKR